LKAQTRKLEHTITEIVKGCQQRQPLMQKRLYEYCYADMMKVAFRYTRDVDKAAQVYNDAMLKVFKSIDIYKEGGKLLAWIKKIVVNTALDFARVKNNFQQHTEIITHNEEDFSIENTVFERMDAQAIRVLINSLPEKTATVFNLYVYEEYNHNEIGILLNIPAGTSRYYLSEARRLLKEKIINPISSLNKEIQP
jgi:RNA polymerase sigma-70 factor, ECF subfamily